jgi:uncharacterized iron-regulated membrane protein
MNLWARILQQPQRLWLRRALFQIHLWAGIGVGLYVLVISITGSVVVFRSELNRYFTVKPTMVEAQGAKALTDEELKVIAEKNYPGFVVANIFRGRRPEQAVEIWMDGDNEIKKQRAFHPFTGEDLGDSIPPGLRLTSWLIDLHDNLLAEERGRFVNGIGGILLTLLCVTGAVIWWPGIRNWRSSLVLKRNAGWKRLNWDIHNVIGFWFFAFVFIWGLSGIYLSMPTPFNIAVDFLEPINEETFAPRFGDDVLVWLGRLHFGRYYGMPMKIVWAVLGLIPLVLFVTGAVMWWNRVLRPALGSVKTVRE